MTPAMNRRERMLAAIERKPLDRIPLDIWATREAFAKLQAHFGEGVDVAQALGIDGFAGASPTYVGPTVPTHGGGITEDFWGMRRKRVDYGTGAYDELFHWPLAATRTIDDLEAYRWPTTDWFDYGRMYEHVKRKHGEQLIQCGYMAPFYYHNLLRGLEQSLVDPLDDPEFTHHLVKRISDFFYEHHRRIFQACRGLIDVAQVTDDLGSQTGPLISLEVYRTFYRPHHKRFIDLCREFGVRVFHHDDGAMRAFLPDLVADGIEILNPIQWRCPGMDAAGLKRDFGGRICFHGGVDNQVTLPHGTPDDVRAEVRWLIDTLAADRTGYILAPCHNIQSVSPVENVLAMYDEARKYGDWTR